MTRTDHAADTDAPTAGAEAALHIATLLVWVAVGMVLGPDGGLWGAVWMLGYMFVYYLALGPTFDKVEAAGWWP